MYLTALIVAYLSPLLQNKFLSAVLGPHLPYCGHTNPFPGIFIYMFFWSYASFLNELFGQCCPPRGLVWS